MPLPVIQMFLNQTQEQQVYFPGQVVSGSIQMTLTESKWCQYVAVHLDGKGSVSWIELEGSEVGGYTRRRCSDNESYANLSVVVLGNRVAPQPTKIDPGLFTIPFQLTIPPHCPPTFKSDIGNIEYKLFGVIKFSTERREYEIETPIIVGPLIDLNQQQNLLQPVNKSAVETLPSCCCETGDVLFNLRMPKTGFCIGQERIPVEFRCRNGSTTMGMMGIIEVAQLFAYNTGRRAKLERSTVSKFSCRIRPFESVAKMITFGFKPSIALGFATRIIRVNYAVRLWVEISDLIKSSILISIPIVIGNVPFHGGGQSAPIRPPDSTQPSVTMSQSSLQQPGSPQVSDGVSPVPMSQSIVRFETPSNAELQCEAPPSYDAVISDERF